MKLILNDRIEIQVQTRVLARDEALEVDVLHIRLLHKGFNEMEAVFKDP